MPTLQVLSPKDGETVTPPTAVRYAVAGYTLGQGGGHIVAFVGGLTDRISVDLQAGNHMVGAPSQDEVRRRVRAINAANAADAGKGGD